MSDRAWMADVSAEQQRAAGGRGPAWSGSVSLPGAGPAPAGPGLGGQPWYYVPPELRQDLILSGRSNIDGAATAGAWQTVASSNLSGNTPAVIRSLYFIAVGTLTAASRVDARVTVNGSPVRGWDIIPIASVPGTSSTVAYGPDETFIIIEAGASWALEARVTDGLVYDVQLGAKGWQR